MSDSVAHAGCAETGTISRQAVHHALRLLAEKRFIRHIHLGGSPALHECWVDDHHHLIWRTCGKTVDIECAVGEAPCLTADDDVCFRIDEAQVIYWGTCLGCLAEASGLGD